METRKGSNTFRMHLARISIDGTDQPVGREATICLRTQHDENKVPNTGQQLMDIYIDGRLMACWDFSRLKKHLSYHLIHVFSSFTLSKHITLTLPLPLNSKTESQDYDDCLKAIRVYFTKAQDFHTAISWLTKQADLKRLDGRPATSNGVRAFISTTNERATGPAVRRSMAPLTQIATSRSQEKPQSRPQSRIGQHPAAQQSGSLQSHSSGLSTQAPTRQHTERPISRSQSRNTMRDFPSRQRQAILRRDMLAAQEAHSSAMGPPPKGAVAFADHELRASQIPRVGILPKRAMSAAPLRSSRPTSYSRGSGRQFTAPSPTALDAPIGRHSPYNFRDHARGVPSPESSQEPPILGGLYLPYPDFEPVPDGTSHHSQIQRLASLSTHSNIAADSMDVDAADPHDNVPDDTARRHRVNSMALPDGTIPGASPDQLPSDWRPTTSSQVVQVGRILHTLPSQLSATLFASTDAMRQDLSDQELSFEGAQGTRGSDQRQNDQVGDSRPPSAQALQRIRETNRKANQTMNCAGHRLSYDQSVGVQASAAVNETQVEASSSNALVAPSAGPNNTTVAFHGSSEEPMVDCVTQTDSWSRYHADVLHLSAVARLDSRLLRNTKQWWTLEDVNRGLLSLSAEFVQGIYDISKAT